MAEAENKTENSFNDDMFDQEDLLGEDECLLKPFGDLVKDADGYIIDEFWGKTKIELSAPPENQSFPSQECINEVDKEADERFLANICCPRQNHDQSFTSNGSVVLKAQFGKGNVMTGTGFFIADKELEGKDEIEVFKTSKGGILGKKRKTRCILTAAHCVMNTSGKLADNITILVINPERYENACVHEETEKKAGNTGGRFDRIDVKVRKVWEKMPDWWKSGSKAIQKHVWKKAAVHVLPEYIDENKAWGSDIALIVLPKAVEAVFADIDAVVTPKTTPEELKYTCVDGYPGESDKSYLLYKSGGFREKGRFTKGIHFGKRSVRDGKPIGAIHYNCQTTQGQSGGCVKLDLGKGQYKVGAVHNKGMKKTIDGVELGTGENWGSLITTYVLDWLYEKQTGRKRGFWGWLGGKAHE